MTESTEYKNLDQIFEPIIVVDGKLNTQYYNHYFATFTKSSPRILKKVGDIRNLISFDQDILKKLVDVCIRDGKTVVSEEVNIELIQNPDTNYTVVFKVIPMAEDLYMVCLNDLSVENQLFDKYRAQLEELRKTHEQIVHNDKLATLGELTAGISHEINNPLTVAYGNAQNIDFFLQDETLETQKEEVIASNKRIMDALERITNIISNMKSYIHSPQQQLEYCELQTILENRNRSGLHR